MQFKHNYRAELKLRRRKEAWEGWWVGEFELGSEEDALEMGLDIWDKWIRELSYGEWEIVSIKLHAVTN